MNPDVRVNSDVPVNPDVPIVTPDWLALREPADAAARSVELAELLRPCPPATVHDLGCGTGSMGRWLAPRLPGPQHWVLYDRDPVLLARAAADGGPASVQTRLRDITRLTAADLAGAGLITASALLDMLTAAEVERIVAACVAAACPALLALSVTGRVELTPADPLDGRIAAAFNAHQRRTTGGRSLLGPDAVEVTVAAFRRRGVGVLLRSTPWRLGAGDAALISEWLAGRLAAACAQEPDLAVAAAAYARRRAAQLAEGALTVVVGHQDLLAGTH